MNRFKPFPGYPSVLATLVAASTMILQAADAPHTYSEDFSGVPVGDVPESFLVLDGQFAVKQKDANRFLELPGAPLDSFGAMFGSSGKEDWGAQARFSGTARGRKYPVFGISVNGLTGYRLQVAPAKRAIELLKGEVVQMSKPYHWNPDGWTQIHLQIRKLNDATWRIEGRVWKDGTPEPKDWQISYDDTKPPVAGKAAIWGLPYSGTPIRFDDVKVLPAVR